MLNCYAHAYSLVELIDVATKQLALVGREMAQEPTKERQQVVTGMLASGLLVDQQQALDLLERLEACVSDAVDQARPDTGVAFAAGALREEVAVAIGMADGFAADYKQAATVMDRFLEATGDDALRRSTNGAFSRFGASVRGPLDQVRLRSDELVEKSSSGGK